MHVVLCARRFTSLYDNYVVGTLNPDSQLLEALPPFSHTSALPFGDGSIMKSGGVGPSNVRQLACHARRAYFDAFLHDCFFKGQNSHVQVNSGSRRLYFGTMNIPGVIPIYDSVHSSAAHKGLNHTMSIPTLPRDLTMAQVRKRPFPNDHFTKTGSGKTYGKHSKKTTVFRRSTLPLPRTRESVC